VTVPLPSCAAPGAAAAPVQLLALVATPGADVLM
jgi:hypothetical protein